MIVIIGAGLGAAAREGAGPGPLFAAGDGVDGILHETHTGVGGGRLFCWLRRTAVKRVFS